MLRRTLPSASVNNGRFLASLLLEEGASIARVYRYQRSSSLTSRCHSSLCYHLPTAKQRQQVDPSLRQRRPHVNGEAVAFHIRDLLPTQQQHSHQTAAAAAPHHEHSHPNLEQQQASSSTHARNEKPDYESDLIVILDMDECLLHSQFLSNPSIANVLAHQVTKSQRRSSCSESSPTNKHQQPKEVDHFRVQLPDGGDLVHVNLRPGLKQFLKEVTSRYETHVFTAAMSIYANPVLDHLEAQEDTHFAARWYRQHCTWDSPRNAYVKNLTTLPLTSEQMARTVLVDNNPLSFLSHPENGILVSSFYNDPSDTTLVAVQRLLKELESHSDVRPLLEHRFGLKQALEELSK